MNTMAAWVMEEASRGNPLMVFDWNKAARLIAERKPNTASAGLQSDWEYTGGPIYANGQPIPQDETYVYLASTWATPELDMDDDVVDCYIMEDEVPAEWVAGGQDYSGIYWPDSARAILASKNDE